MFMLLSLALAIPSPSLPLADLRSQTPMILVGFILLAAGVAAVTLFFVRRQSRDLTLIYFSISQSSTLFGFSCTFRRSVRWPMFPTLSWIISIYGLHSPF
jgi:hypothetical protein